MVMVWYFFAPNIAKFPEIWVHTLNFALSEPYLITDEILKHLWGNFFKRFFDRLIIFSLGKQILEVALNIL